MDGTGEGKGSVRQDGEKTSAAVIVNRRRETEPRVGRAGGGGSRSALILRAEERQPKLKLGGSAEIIYQRWRREERQRQRASERQAAGGEGARAWAVGGWVGATLCHSHLQRLLGNRGGRGWAQAWLGACVRACVEGVERVRRGDTQHCAGRA